MKKNQLLYGLLVCVVSIAGLSSNVISTEKVETGNTIQGMQRKYIPPAPPSPLESTNCRELSDVFKSGDTMASLLDRHGFSPGEIHEIATIMRPVFSPARIRIGSMVTLFQNRETSIINRIDILVSSTKKLSLIKKNKTWSAELIDDVLFRRLNHVSGTIEVSLWSSAQDNNIPPEVILDLADMFGWQVDFTSGLRKGDQFKLYFKTDITAENRVVPGEIIAACFVNNGNKFWGFRFELEDGSYDYFDENGQSLRRAFLKSPLRYRTISSGYSKRRFHPILKIYRPHLGIDYAAPKGTPVSALGDGVVSFCGRKGGYGKFIQVKHGDTYETCYAHLSKYAKGVKKGSHVKQGQIIGYVGSTGLSTGPHLDFRVKYRGQFVNPNTIKSDPAKPVPELLKDNYNKHCAVWMERLQS